MAKYWLFYPFCFLLLALGAFKIFSGGSVEAGVAFTAAFVCALFANLDRFESFKGLGIEARLAEKEKKIDDTITEAQVVLGHLRDLAMSVAQTTSFIFGSKGRWVGPQWDRQLLMLNDIEKRLAELNIPEEEVKSLRENVDHYILVDLLGPTHKVIRQLIDHIREESRPKPKHPNNTYDASQNEEIIAHMAKFTNLDNEFSELCKAPFELEDPLARFILFIEKAEIFDEKVKIELKKLYEANSDAIYVCLTERNAHPKLMKEFRDDSQDISDNVNRLIELTTSTES